MGVTKIINAFDFAAADLITMIGKAIHDKVSTEKIALRCSQLSARAKADTLLLSSLLSDNKEALPQKAKHMEEVSG